MDTTAHKALAMPQVQEDLGPSAHKASSAPSRDSTMPKVLVMSKAVPTLAEVMMMSFFGKDLGRGDGDELLGNDHQPASAHAGTSSVVLLTEEACKDEVYQDIYG